MEDLWPFNEERIARAIVRSQKPVISAVGHEVDFTICDFVADLRAATPSAAAEIVIKSKADLADRVEQLESRLLANMKSRLSGRMTQRVDDLGFRLEQLVRAGTFIQRRAHRIEICEQRLSGAIQQRLRRWQHAFARIAHTLDALSPLAVLERGYAICLTPDGRVIRSADAVAVGEDVKIRLHEGTLLANVTSKEKKPAG